MSFKVKAVYEYSSPHEDDLEFPIGQIITVTDEEDAEWYGGEYLDESGVKHEGIFPRNFVEKYEPTAPPRPTRTRTKKEHEPAAPVEPAPASEESAPAPPSPKQGPPSGPSAEAPEASPLPSPRAAPALSKSPAVASPPPAPKAAEPVLPASPLPVPAEPAAQPSPTAAEAPVKRGPPPVSQKPTSSSFKDRIAAFNKPAAPPIAPFKPGSLGGSGSSGFIRKPFVAPPPSGNTYVPVQRDIPTAKVYRRGEDPEIKEREAQNLHNAERAGLVPTEHKEGEEDQPKPMSLKERMALLQKQQVEQAQRHADAVAKKKRASKPPRQSSHELPAEGAEEDLAGSTASLERHDTGDATGKKSLDEPHPPRMPAAPRRKSSRGPEPRDGNEADMSGAGDTTEDPEDLTEKDDSDEKPRRPPRVAAGGQAPPEEAAGEGEEDDDEEEEEEEEEDPEIRRKAELRARMAKMSGGMGMPGMFGMMPMPGPAPPKRKKTAPRSSEDTQPFASPSAAPPVPTMMALPGMSVGQPRESHEDTAAAEEPPAAAPGDEEQEEEEEEEEPPHSPPAAPKRTSVAAPPPIPGGRPAPPPVPTDSRPPPLPASLPAGKTLSEGSESDDELSAGPVPGEPLETPRGEAPPSGRAPLLPPVAVPPPPVPMSPRSPTSPSRSNGGDQGSQSSPMHATSSKRASRPPPPVPGSAPALPPTLTRPPPPPPPGGVSRTSTADSNRPLSPSKAFSHADEGEGEVTEYEGDYDTDIASSVPHKDALKSHGRESSLEDTLSVTSPTEAPPPSMPPPVPTGAAPRAVPPPPPVPSQPPPDSRRSIDSRRSVDAPRAAPPPPPPPKTSGSAYDDDYDPYNYNALASPKVPVMPGVAMVGLAQPAAAPQPPPSHPAEDIYSPQEEDAVEEASSSYQSPAEHRAPPPAPPTGRAPAARQSMEVRPTRRSMDPAGRPSVSLESGFVANDLDLAPQSGWWLQPNGLPPQLQGRKDIFFESEESQSNQRGGKTVITRDIYILYQDYSQTVITVRFDPQDAGDTHLEQRHEPPPRSLRQDQLEQAYERFGRAIAEGVAAKKDTVVADGTPQGLVHELLRPHRDALLPVGTRAYGALVYANLANASTAQHDEIRPGDILSVRNARFQGKHGPMHAKYSAEVGRPDHVAVVAEWDGTKKKVRAWEQGRENKKVKLESYKLDDLRSGEVKVWRVMPRSWVGWEGQGQS